VERIALKTNCALAFVIAGILAVGPAVADKPSWAGGGKGEKGERDEHREKQQNKKSRQRDGDARSPRDHAGSTVERRQHFGDRHRTLVHDYYNEQFRTGRCPPGLAKKNNGCMPPGQAKKWAVGRPLPRDVVYYEVPSVLVVQFGQPPTGHRYVRVAGDILLIALGTGMVVDAMQDLRGM
jgi:Ni/Co efflux regulator RcnB